MQNISASFHLLSFSDGSPCPFCCKDAHEAIVTARPQQCQAEHGAVSTTMLLDVQEMCRKLLLTRCGTAVEGFQKVVSSGTSCKTRDNLLPMVCSLFFLKKPNPTSFCNSNLDVVGISAVAGNVTCHEGWTVLNLPEMPGVKSYCQEQLATEHKKPLTEITLPRLFYRKTLC